MTELQHNILRWFNKYNSGNQLVTAKGNGNNTNSNVKVTPTNTNNKINKDNNSLGRTANAKAGEYHKLVKLMIVRSYHVIEWH